MKRQPATIPLTNTAAAMLRDFLDDHDLSQVKLAADLHISPQLLNDILDNLRNPPGNRLELLRGSLEGMHSIRINNQWRITFRWEGKDAHDVKITDYH